MIKINLSESTCNFSSQHALFFSTGNSSITAQDAEAQLKALLFGRKGSTPSSSGTGSPSVASPLSQFILVYPQKTEM